VSVQATQLWLELPPMSKTAPPRLMVFLHGEGSSPEIFAPVALSWQLKFPGATVLVMQGPVASAPGYWQWYQNTDVGAKRVASLQDATKQLAFQLREIQTTRGFSAETTILVGFSQGANVILELVRSDIQLCGLVISYAGRLLRPVGREESVSIPIHLVHGGLDSLVPLVYARQAFDGFNAIGCNVSLDILEDGAHYLGQEMIILGTTRAMQSVFQHRKKMMLRNLN
jgi:phospholipase/carboxylesterase